MGPTTNRNSLRGFVGVRGLAAAAGLALGLAAPTAAGQIDWRNDTLVEREPTREGRAVIERRENGDTLRVVVEDGRVTSVTINGRPVPSRRVRQAGEAVEVLDESGRVDRVIAIDLPEPPEPPLRPRFPGEAEAPPRVMLGVYMTDAGEAIRRQLRLGDRPVVQIYRVIEGLPAERAGIEEHDLIVAIDRRGGVSRDELSGLLRDRSPGDVLRMTVLRAGREREVEVRLDAFDESRLALDRETGETEKGLAPAPPPPPAPLPGGAGDVAGRNGPGGLGAWFSSAGGINDSVRGAMEAALSAMEDARARLPAEQGEGLEAARDAMERAIRDFERSGVLRFNVTPGQGGRGFVLDNNRLIRVPGSSTEDERLEMLTSRLSELSTLNERLERIDDRLARFERTVDRLERVLDRLEERP